MSVRAGLIASVVAGSLTGAAATASDWQSLAQIRNVAEAFVTSATDDASVTVAAATLDQRLRLPACGSALEPFWAPGARSGPNATVGVRCREPRQWKVYVPVRASRPERVIVASRPLSAGTAIGPNDVVLRKHDVFALGHGYLRSVAELAGKTLRRPVRPGTVLTPQMLANQPLISRGQRLTLLARGGPVRIRMAAVALSDGAAGQRIRVRNLSSGRVVEGIVRSAEQVEVLLK